MDGEDFVREILLGAMRMRAIVGGEDLRFGKAGAVNAIKLKTLGERLHFSVYIIPKETEAGEEISSSLIREALAAGDMEKANILLGMPYTAEGVVQHGNGIGKRVLGFPTVNLMLPENKLLPRRGVYRTETVQILRCDRMGWNTNCVSKVFCWIFRENFTVRAYASDFSSS